MKSNERKQRLGLLLPSSNSTQEPEFSEVLPPSISLHTARLTLTSIDADSTVKIVEELEHEAGKLAHADVDAVLLAATAPTSRKGLGYDRELMGRIASASGKPATTASTAMLEAFSVVGAKRIALAAPWSAEVNQTVANFIEANGYQVANQKAMGVVKNNDVGRLDSYSAYDLALEADTADADVLFLACGNWWVMEQVERIEQRLGKPVLTTNQVSIWAALRLLEFREPLRGWGRLLEEFLTAEKA
ncbi:hypothetical protein [Caballeronia sp. GAWG2-1]|uniref:maleate cis-trans isomerase family protein n=1 Tax=Caballeronia sp. GAWG2-1 TaxID=2921744 RepID=UPI00202964A9|nr:hypothetical protein [Caballeronia sp. GAWG2-1]